MSGDTSEEPWLTVTIGERRWTMREMLADIQRIEEYRVFDIPEVLLDRRAWFRWRKEPKTIPLYVRTSEELGLSNPTFEEVVVTAREHGFKLCPRETALYVMQAYPKSCRRIGENPVFIASYPFSLEKLRRKTDPSRVQDYTTDELLIFEISLCCGDGMVLRRRVTHRHPGHRHEMGHERFYPRARWVFTK